MKISVVIPVFNEEKHIKKVLEALINNTTPPDEILLSDGGSTDRTIQIVHRFFPEVRILHNEKQHAAAGRNLGIQHAGGDVIAFTDGDCIVSRDWIENIRCVFEDDTISGIGGKVVCAVPENRFEAYWGNLAWNVLMQFGDEKYTVTERSLNDAFVTANCAYRKELLNELGGFRDFFANNAEDVDLSWRALEKHAKLVYDPSVVIFAHNVTTRKGIAKKSFRNGVSSSKLQKVYGGVWNFDPMIYKMLGANIAGLFKRKPDAALNVMELICHLAGKYYGSIKVGVLNF